MRLMEKNRGGNEAYCTAEASDLPGGNAPAVGGLVIDAGV